MSNTADETQADGVDSGLAGLRLDRITRFTLIAVSAIGVAYFARQFVLPLVIAGVSSMALKPPMNLLRKLNIPSPLAAVVVLAVFGSVLCFGAATFGKPVSGWIKSAPETLPRLKERFQQILRPAAHLSAVASTVGDLGNSDVKSEKPQPVEVRDNRVASSLFNWTWTFMGGIIETVVLLFFLLASGDLLMQKVVRVMPTLHDKKRAVEVAHEIQHNISTYLFSVGMINICLGAVVGTGFYLAGMPAPTIWGGVAAVLNFIPYLGPIMGTAAITVAGLLSFDTVGRGLLPAAIFLVCHLFEANVVTPFILGKRFTINPTVIFVSLMFFLWLWGFAGALLAVPLVVTLKAICDHMPQLSSLGELLSSDRAKPDSSG